jgi:hypothetical protein
MVTRTVLILIHYTNVSITTQDALAFERATMLVFNKIKKEYSCPVMQDSLEKHLKIQILISVNDPSTKLFH